MADPKGGVRAEAPTTIRYNGTAVFMAFTPVCLDANTPAPFKIPSFLIVGISFLPLEAGIVRLRVVFFAGMFKPVLPDS
tara:strand:- start:879 stop:1115 length:237 start_codon:yes stop_codon:yes gene_type:complete